MISWDRGFKFVMLASSLRVHVWRVFVWAIASSRYSLTFGDTIVSLKINVDLWKDLALWLSRGAVYECAIARAPV